MNNLLKTKIFIFILLAQSQIIYGQIDSLGLKKNKLPVAKEKLGDEAFAGVSNVLGHRTLQRRNGIFGSELGIRADETPLWTMSYEVGYRLKMKDRFSLEFGLEFNRIGMKYRTPVDSSFVGYDSQIQGFTTPIRGNIQWGEDFIFTVGLGAAPRMLMSSRYTTIEKDNFGKENRSSVSSTNGFNSFNVDAIFNLGFRWNFGENLGLYFIPEFRYGLLDTYQKQNPYVEHTYGLFVRWGLQYLL